MEGQTRPGEPGAQSGPPTGRAHPTPPSEPSSSAFRRLWWLWVLIGVIAVFLIAFFIGRATNDDTVAPDTTTSTTEATIPNLPAPTMAITEKQNGSTVVVGTGWVVLLQLTGNPEDGSAWDVNAINADLVQVFPGPQISYVAYAPTPEAIYTFSGLTLDEGDVQVQANNVSFTGKVNRTFSCTIRIVSEDQLSTTTTVAESTTTASSTTTSSSTTTTEVTTTTTTEATTTTTAASTTTTAKPTTTTTKPPTTTTKPPTTTTTLPPTTTTTKPPTTTTKPPTTTTTKPPTTTTTLPFPPIDVPEGTVLIGPKANGQIQVVPTTATALVLALPDDTSDNLIWQLDPYDNTVIDLREDPRFVPAGPGSTEGALVWTFDVVGPGATDLKLVYADEAGGVAQQFFVSISVQELTITPF